MRRRELQVSALIAIVLSLVVTGCGGVTSTPTLTPTSDGSETVTFPDGNLEAAIRDALGKPPSEDITAA